MTQSRGCLVSSRPSDQPAFAGEFTSPRTALTQSVGGKPSIGKLGVGSIWRKNRSNSNRANRRNKPQQRSGKGDDDTYQTLETKSEGSRQKCSSRKQEAASDRNGLDGITWIETDPLELPREEEDYIEYLAASQKHNCYRAPFVGECSRRREQLSVVIPKC